MLLGHHSAFRVGVHRWSRYELWQKGDVYVSHSYAHAVRRSVVAVRSSNRNGRISVADGMHGSSGEGFYPGFCGAIRISGATVDDRITNALVGGIGQNRIGVHQPAQFKDEEHNHENHDDHQSGLKKSLAALTSPPTLLPRSHR